MAKRDLPPWLQSSVDPAKISLTVKGAIIFVPSIVLLASYFGLHLQAETMGEMVNQAAAIVGGLATVYGLVRKLWAGE